MEEILKEITQVLFDDETLSKAKEQIQNRREKVPVDSQNISFRLFLAPDGNINLEIMMRDDFGMYFKPVGFYTFSNGSMKSIHILKEFEEPYSKIKSTLPNNLTAIVKTLTLEENGYIAMASREVGNTVRKMFKSPNYSSFNHINPAKFQNERLISNGLGVLVRTSMAGALEANLIDDEDLEEDIFVMYQNNNGISVHCTEDIYSQLMSKSLLSIFK